MRAQMEFTWVSTGVIVVEQQLMMIIASTERRTQTPIRQIDPLICHTSIASEFQKNYYTKLLTVYFTINP